MLEEKNHDARLAADSNFSVTIYPNFTQVKGKPLTTTRYHNTDKGVTQLQESNSVSGGNFFATSTGGNTHPASSF